jgi:hypothetical protein
MGKVNVWKELEGAKESLREEVDIKIGDTEVTMEVKLVELDEIQEITDKYEDGKFFKKPVVEVPTQKGKKEISVPTDEKKYQRFNTHPKAKEWQKKVDKRVNYHMAYEFLADEYKPADDVDKAIEIMRDERNGIRYSDVIAIVNKGMEVSGFGKQLGKQNGDS